jgi:hypothetical protein
MTMTVAAGESLARALAAKDGSAMAGLLADPIDFQALTPGRHWQAATPSEVVDEIMLGQWFGPEDEIVDLEAVTTGSLPGREHVSYRLRVRTDGTDYVVEQQAYYNADDGPAGSPRITWLRILCSGYREVGS